MCMCMNYILLSRHRHGLADTSHHGTRAHMHMHMDMDMDMDMA
jgi:hypothetical protein